MRFCSVNQTHRLTAGDIAWTRPTAEVNTTYEATDYLDLPTDAPLILPTDKDEANVELFSRLPIQPDHLPFLPPPHLYKTTPVRTLFPMLYSISC